MTKISWVSVSDLHLREQDKWGKFRLDDRLSNIGAAVEFAVKHGVDRVNCLGDIFHTLNPSEKLRKLFYDTFVIPLLKAHIPIFLIVGNHDSDGKIFNLMAEEYWFGTAIGFNVLSDLYMDKHLVYVPFGCEGKISGIKNKKTKVLFGHLVLDGAEVGPRSYRLQSSYSPSVLRDFMHCELGDIHKHQVIGDNIWYCGAIAKDDFGERNETKGFLYSVLDSKGIRTEFISVVDRAFVQLDVNEYNYEDILKSVGKGSNLVDAVCKVVVDGSSEFIKSVRWNEYRDLLKSVCKSVRFEFHRTDSVVDSRVSDNLFRMSIKAVMEDYAKNAGIKKKDLEFGLLLLEA